MRVLVTGGAGYIGSHTCKALAIAGHQPIVYDNLVTGHRKAVKWGPFEYGDLLDFQRLSDVLKKHKPDAVIHFAAFAYVSESVLQPGKYYRNNVVGSLSLVEACHQNGVSRLIFSSTCATYGDQVTLPITEDTAQRPVNPYGRSKLMVEAALRDYANAFGLTVVALRYFNAAGSDPEGDLGEEHDPETHLIPLVLNAAAGQCEQLVIHGVDYETRDGTCVRDYVHVSDLADAHVLALNYSAGAAPFTAMNLGTGRGLTVREIVQAAERVTGRRVGVSAGPRRPGDPPELVADAAIARQQLGWSARRSDVDTIISTAWNWQLRNG